MKRVTIEDFGDELFVLLDDIPIAKRGDGTPQWKSLRRDYAVIDGDDGKPMVQYKGRILPTIEGASRNPVI